MDVIRHLYRHSLEHWQSHRLGNGKLHDYCKGADDKRRGHEFDDDYGELANRVCVAYVGEVLPE